jgi:hypothetical protein
MRTGTYVKIKSTGNTGLVMETWTNENGTDWVRVFTEFGADFIFRTNEVSEK